MTLLQRLIVELLFISCSLKDEFHYRVYKLFGIWLPSRGCYLASLGFELQDKWGFA